ncbi:MAG: beta-ketoacyl-ACP synthase II [Acidobacteriota bacterium]
MKRRVVVTGVGVVSPLGLTAEETWRRSVKGESGIGPITLFDASSYPVRIAGETKGFDPLNYMDKKDARKMDRFIQFACAAAAEAVDRSGLAVTPENAERVGVAVGSGIGGLSLLEEQHKILLERGPGRISPFFIPGMIINMASGQISIRYGAKGPNIATVSACSTASHAIGEAARYIQRGEADAMICGGAEAAVSPLAVAGFAAMRALSTRNEEPTRASRPYDQDRDGFVMGEGAGVLILEAIEHAQARGAQILAEVSGYGLSGDAYHISAPSEDGDGPTRVMLNAIRDAGLNPSDIQYINAHGTATPVGDKVETLAIKRAFGDHAGRLCVSSTKSMTGHLLGAAGGLEAVLTILAIRDQVAPPTINLEKRDPECDLDYVPNTARPMEIIHALSNSFGFGGTNASLLLSRYAAGA